jgi:hypothetical protein
MTSLKNLGSLITVTGGDGHEHCLGYLIDFKGHGIFSPNGKVDITKEQMDAHNKALEEGELKGLDEGCKVGQCGTFYYINGTVQTFLGTKVNETIRLGGSNKRRTITFTRKGKTFRGILRKDADCFNFKRIA